MAEERKKFFHLVKRLHVYYRDQLSAALISVNKFNKGNKYFIRALREICPARNENVPVLTLRDLEENLTRYGASSTDQLNGNGDVSNGMLGNDVNSDVLGDRLEIMTVSTRASSSLREKNAITDHKAHFQIFETFLKNVQNFRLFRQHVKMSIIGKLRKLPSNIEETDMQKRIGGELEALLSAWTTLLDRNNNLIQLVHPGVKEQAAELFDTELEVSYYTGVLSVLPKLTDIANKVEFSLTKYEMSA